MHKIDAPRSWEQSVVPISNPNFLHMERTSEGIVAISRDRSKHEAGVQEVIPESSFDHLLCGLAGEGGIGLGLGILQKIDSRDETVALTTPVAKEEIRFLQFGDLYLHPSGQEIAKRSSFLP